MVQVDVAQTFALRGIHGAVVKVEVQIPHLIFFFKPDVPVSHAGLFAVKGSSGISGTSARWSCKAIVAASLKVDSASFLCFKWTNPECAIHGSTANGIITLGDDCSGLAGQIFFAACIKQIIGFTKQRIQYTGESIGGMNFSKNGEGIVLLPIDAAVGLPDWRV